MATTDAWAVEGIDGTELATLDTSGAFTTAAGITATTGGITATAGGITATAGGLTVTAGGLTVTAGGLTVTAGGATVNGATTRGGVVYAATDASAAVTNTTTETAFDNSYTFPANTFAAGDCIRIRGWGTTTAGNGTDTLTIKVKIGSTAILTSAAVDQVDNDLWAFDCLLTIRTIGASGTLVGHAISQYPDAPGSTVRFNVLASTAIDTTTTQAVTCTATWSAASTADSCRLDQFVIEHL